jgi:hypothetical protein
MEHLQHPLLTEPRDKTETIAAIDFVLPDIIHKFEEYQSSLSVEPQRLLQFFYKQISGHKFMFLDSEKNVCKMSNLNEIAFYQHNCPLVLRDFVPKFYGDFHLVPGKDRIDLEEEFDINQYCSTLASTSSWNSSQMSSLESDHS